MLLYGSRSIPPLILNGNKTVVFSPFFVYVPERERKGVDMTDNKSSERKIAEASSKPFSNALQDAMRNSKALQDTIRNSNPLQDALRNLPSVSAPQNDAKGLPSSLAPATARIPSSSGKKIQSVSDIGVAVRTARKSKSQTQQEFADLAGVGRRFLSELESGKQTLEIGKVLKVAGAAGIQLMLVSKADE
jgi:y4mF family transcriptional regulator